VDWSYGLVNLLIFAQASAWSRSAPG